MTPVTFDVRDVFPQRLTIQIRGAAVLELESHASPEEESPIPDLGDLFLRAVQAGLFAGAATPPWSSTAEVTSAEVDLAERSARWTLWLAGIDPGALRVIWNILHTLDLDDAALFTEGPPSVTGPKAARLDVPRLRYPCVYGRPPFGIDVEPPLRSSRDRLVQVVFENPPPEAEVDATISTMELWTRLLLLGGYAEEGARRSGVFPDPALQLDEVTVQQGFPELFAADEAAFNAIINHAISIHKAGSPIAAVVVR